MQINLENDSHALPPERIKEILDLLPYGDQARVMIQFLAVTGCRISELDKFYTQNLFLSKGSYYLIWTPGKNQKTPRKEIIPSCLVEELRECRKNRRTYKNRFFSMTHETLRRIFNRDIRPQLGPAWQERRIKLRRGQLQTEYFLQLKGFRKTFQTLTFAKELKKWNHPGIALEFTSKKMRHSSKHITAYHYLENFDTMKSCLDMDPKNLTDPHDQKHLQEFI